MNVPADLPADPEMLRQLDENLNILMLVKGQLPDGSNHYAYASIPPSRYRAFKEAEAKGDYDLAEYGTILFHADGLEPSLSVRKKMEEDYGANHRFEEELAEATEQLRQALLKQKPEA